MTEDRLALKNIEGLLNRVERLAMIVGGKSRLADIIERDKSIVTRMVKRGRIRYEFNAKIKSFLSDHKDELGEAKVMVAMGCLDDFPTCPTCGQFLPE